MSQRSTRAQPRPGHPIRRGIATLIALLLAIAIQPCPQHAAAAPPLEDAVYAWTIARDWLDRSELPRVQDAEAAVALRDVYGVSVLVRLGGRIVGRGMHVGGDGLALRTAMAGALSDIFSSDGTARALEVDPEGFGRRLTLEIELAGELIPLLGATYRDAVERVDPGVDGVAMRRRDQITLAFPGAMLAANVAGRPATVFTSLATELGLGLADLGELRRSEEIEVYRFAVRRLVQPTEGAVPVAPTRSDELVVERNVTRDRAVEALEGMISRAQLHHWQRPMGSDGEIPFFRGDYRASGDDVRQPRASDFEQAIVAFALARAIGSGVGDRFEVDAWRMARNAVVGVRQFIESDGVVDDWTTALEPRAVAAMVLALEAIERASVSVAVEEHELAAPVTGQLATAANARLRAIVGSDGSVTVVDESGAEQPASGHDQSLIAAALAMSATDDTSRALAAASTDVAWSSVPEALRPGLLPWIAIAELELRRAGIERDPGPLLRLRESIFAAQVGFNDLELAPDLRGGLALVGVGVTPNSQSLRPMAATALLLGAEALTPEPVRDTMWRRQLAFTRFLLQLTVRPPFDGMHRSPDRARWGVRMSMWDGDQPVAAQAMAILALAETIRVWPADAATTPGRGGGRSRVD